MVLKDSVHLLEPEGLSCFVRVINSSNVGLILSIVYKNSFLNLGHAAYI
jgi:hypothetical protein